MLWHQANDINDSISGFSFRVITPETSGVSVKKTLFVIAGTGDKKARVFVIFQVFSNWPRK
jgi:hypothetical protein